MGSPGAAPDRLDVVPLVEDLYDRFAAVGLAPPDAVRALAELLIRVGQGLGEARQDRTVLLTRLREQSSLAAALILQGTILREWVDDPGAPDR